MIRVAVAGQNRLYRDGIERFLRVYPDIEVVATAEDADRVVGVCGEMRPDVALLDWSMPGCLNAIRTISRDALSTHVLLLSAPQDDDQLLACAQAGVSGYAGLDTSLEDLVLSIRAVARGELRCSPRFAGNLIRQVFRLASTGSGGPGGEASLTRRELEVLDRLEQGLSNKEIAVSLHVEVATVKNHVHNVLEKLAVQRRGEAAAWCRRHRGPSRLSPATDPSFSTPAPLPQVR
jgi:DNA-binding NarL/FixJ family response regulator